MPAYGCTDIKDWVIHRHYYLVSAQSLMKPGKEVGGGGGGDQRLSFDFELVSFS